MSGRVSAQHERLRRRRRFGLRGIWRSGFVLAAVWIRRCSRRLRCRGGRVRRSCWRLRRLRPVRCGQRRRLCVHRAVRIIRRRRLLRFQIRVRERCRRAAVRRLPARPLHAGQLQIRSRPVLLRIRAGVQRLPARALHARELPLPPPGAGCRFPISAPAFIPAATAFIPAAATPKLLLLRRQQRQLHRLRLLRTEVRRLCSRPMHAQQLQIHARHCRRRAS